MSDEKEENEIQQEEESTEDAYLNIMEQEQDAENENEAESETESDEEDEEQDGEEDQEDEESDQEEDDEPEDGDDQSDDQADGDSDEGEERREEEPQKSSVETPTAPVPNIDWDNEERKKFAEIWNRQLQNEELREEIEMSLASKRALEVSCFAQAKALIEKQRNQAYRVSQMQSVNYQRMNETAGETWLKEWTSPQFKQWLSGQPKYVHQAVVEQLQLFDDVNTVRDLLERFRSTQSNQSTGGNQKKQKAKPRKKPSNPPSVRKGAPKGKKRKKSINSADTSEEAFLMLMADEDEPMMPPSAWSY